MIQVTAAKLATAPDDANKEQSQANQDAVTVLQDGNNIVIRGSLDALNSFASTNPSQGTAKWVGLDLGTNVNDITKLTWNGSCLGAEDVAEAASVGLGAGHIIFWAKAEQLPRTIKIGGEGYTEAEIVVSFVGA